MRFFNNPFFRFFARAFLIGASIPLLAATSDSFQGLKVERGKFVLRDAPAWLALAAICGTFSGLLGLSIASLQHFKGAR